MRRRTIWGALSLALSLSIAGPVPAADVALRIGSSNSPESALGRGLNKVAALVDQANVGLKLQIFPSGQLGNPEAQVQNVKLGVQDGFFEDLTWWSPFASDLRIAGVPFEFDGRAHFEKWLKSDTFRSIQGEIVKNGGQRLLVGTPLWWRGPYRVLMSSKPVSTLDDISKIKLRQPAIEALTATGAAPDWLERRDDRLGRRLPRHQAGRGRRRDAAARPRRKHQVRRGRANIVITDEFPQILVLGINERKWQALTPAQQSTLTAAIDEAGKGYNKEVTDSEQKWKNDLSAAGARFTTLDRKPFVEKVQQIDKKGEAEGYWTRSLLESVNALR